MQKTLSIVSLQNIVYNAQFVKNIIGSRLLFAVVKANAYGHGDCEVALAIQNIVDGFCVAIVDEGAALRAAGIEKPVLVLTPPMGKDDILRAEYYNLSLSINSLEAAKAAKNCPCHIKVNTGMNRYGCDLSGLERIIGEIPKHNVKGVYSHLFAPENDKTCAEQLELFSKAEKIVKYHCPQAIAHLSASGGVLRGGEYLKDGVRVGILLYGYAPAGFSAAVKPAMRVYAKKVQSQRMIGSGAGYAVAKRRYKTLSAYRAGYADGFSRGVPLGEGKLCMDAFISQNTDELLPIMTDAQSYANKTGSIPYEVLCSVTKRTEYRYE